MRDSEEAENIELYKIKTEEFQKIRQILNDLQSDTRKRVDTLAKLIFVLSGSTLTISIGLFLRENAIPLNPEYLFTLKFAWWCLFGSMAAFTIVLGLMIFEAYVAGLEWDRIFAAKPPISFSQKLHSITQYADWTIGLLGFFGFIIGLFLLAKVVTGLLVTP